MWTLIFFITAFPHRETVVIQGFVSKAACESKVEKVIRPFYPKNTAFKHICFSNQEG